MRKGTLGWLRQNRFELHQKNEESKVFLHISLATFGFIFASILIYCIPTDSKEASFILLDHSPPLYEETRGQV